VTAEERQTAESTPTVMLGQSSGWELRTMMHAIERGAGWRVDCWGDWGFWGWGTHMEDLYPTMIANATAADPTFPDTWQHAPVELEICGTVAQWQDEFGNGYRFVLDVFNHAGTVRPGESVTFVSHWNNIGVAPAYHRRDLTCRLRSAGRTVLFTSTADITTWLPGEHGLGDSFDLPADLEPRVYALEVALLDRAGTAPDTTALPPTRLGIEGRTADGWYAVSEVTVAP